MSLLAPSFWAPSQGLARAWAQRAGASEGRLGAGVTASGGSGIALAAECLDREVLFIHETIARSPSACVCNELRP
eukprot:6590644-Pyramimonas_sp.AAC.2